MRVQPTTMRTLCTAGLALLAVGAAWMSAAARDPTLVTVAAGAPWLLLLPAGAAWGVRLARSLAQPGLRIPFHLASAFAFWLVLFSVAATHWPLRLAFACSRPGLERLADGVAGHSVRVPVRAGPFTIREVEARGPEVICLWVHLDPNGPKGFVRLPARQTDIPLNVWSRLRLDQRWQLIAED